MSKVAVKNMNSSLRIFYLRDENKFPIATVATALILSSDLSPLGVTYGIAVWNPKDKFDKALSRQIAQGRMEMNGYYIYSKSNFKSAVMQNITQREDLPNKVRKAAERWLDRAPLEAHEVYNEING